MSRTRRATSEAGSEPRKAHRIPGRPIERVERRLGDRWVGMDEYAEASKAAADEDLLELSATERADCAGQSTIRIHLTGSETSWPTRSVAPCSSTSTSGATCAPAQRLYAFMQGHHRDDYDGRIYFYLAPPTQYTLGISTDRLDRAAAAVGHDLTSIWHADRRYRTGDGFRRHKHANTKWPAFACDAARRPSAPTESVKDTRSVAKRPAGLHGACARLCRHSILAHHDVVDPLEREHARRAGLDVARREAELVRQAVQRPLTHAGVAPHDASRAATGQRGARDGDDEPEIAIGDRIVWSEAICGHCHACTSSRHESVAPSPRQTPTIPEPSMPDRGVHQSHGAAVVTAFHGFDAVLGTQARPDRSSDRAWTSRLGELFGIGSAAVDADFERGSAEGVESDVGGGVGWDDVVVEIGEVGGKRDAGAPGRAAGA